MTQNDRFDEPFPRPAPNPAVSAAIDQVLEILTAAGHDPEGAGLCYRADHEPLLLKMIYKMPSDKAHDHLTHYAAALTAAGLGVATIGRDGQIERLIVAADQTTADQHVPSVMAYLDGQPILGRTTATSQLRPEDIPRDLIDAVYPVALAHGIPWHDDAVRVLAAAVLTEARQRIAAAIEVECIDPDDTLSVNGATAAGIVRNWPEAIL
ncbi:hypothetical protein [Sphaerisporangium aureirubrum]|uniref:Uncharacterized protein n=1 Tax=Sphaerisporangium aureirubrum TaxID=1544736 RepID=A0ABW1NCB2_9ACTN